MQARHLDGTDNENHRRAGGPFNKSLQANGPTGSPTIRPIDLLLPLLTHVRSFGQGWRADCPIGHRSRGALSVTVGDDDRILLHCFAGCDVADVLASAGLTVSDLFVRRVTHDATPQERRELRQRAKASQWVAALGVLSVEAAVVEAAAITILGHRQWSDDDVERLVLAVERIGRAREVLA